MISSINIPVQRFEDINGRPLVGGRLYTYAAGTSEPATTYMDDVGTENTNPIVLNERGECKLYVDSSVSYKFVLKDDHDVVIWEVDNVVSGGEGGGGSGVDVDVVGTENEITVRRVAINRLERFVVGLSSSVKNTINNLIESISSALDSLSAKADKVQGATAGNLAALDASGNLTDSGSKSADFKTKQTPVADPSASGTGLDFVSSVSQNANGEITASKKSVQDGTTAQKGVVKLNNAIDSTSVTEAATPKAVKDAYDALNNKIVARATFLSQAEWDVQRQLPGDPAKVYYVENGTGEDAYTVYVWKESTSTYEEVDESSIDLDGYWHDGPTTTGNGNVVTNITLGNDGVPQVEKGLTALTQHQSVTDNNPTLAWGTTSKVGTVGSTDLRVTMPANPAQDLSSLKYESIGSTAVDLNDLLYAGECHAYVWAYANRANVANRPTNDGCVVLSFSYYNTMYGVQVAMDGNDYEKQLYIRFKAANQWGNWIPFRDASWINSGTFGTDRIADDAITAAKVKDNETLPVNISGSALKINNLIGSKAVSSEDKTYQLLVRFRTDSYSRFSLKLMVGGETGRACSILFITVERNTNTAGLPAIAISKVGNRSYAGGTQYGLEYTFDSNNNYLYLYGVTYAGIPMNPILIDDTSKTPTLMKLYSITDTITAPSNTTPLTIRVPVSVPLDTSVGSATTPVYVDSNGQVQECDVLSGGTINFNRTFTTTYTVGSTDQYITTVIKNDNIDLIADYVTWHNANVGKLTSPPMIIISVHTRSTDVVNPGLITLNMYKNGNGCDVFGESYTYMGNQNGSSAYNTQYFTDQTFVSGSAYYLNIRNETSSTMWTAGTILDISIRIVAHAVSVT